jgi:hypothetical protein
MDEALRKQMTLLLQTPGNAGRAGEARRVWGRIRGFAHKRIVTPIAKNSALELCCYALQLPVASGAARAALKQRCQEAGELLVGAVRDAEKGIAERALELLADVPGKSPRKEEAKVLADAVNLEDFSVSGLLWLCGRMAGSGSGMAEIAAALNRREEYGYWEARLKDGFHFAAVAEIAKRRLEKAREIGRMLTVELAEDLSDETK